MKEIKVSKVWTLARLESYFSGCECVTLYGHSEFNSCSPCWTPILYSRDKKVWNRSRGDGIEDNLSTYLHYSKSTANLIFVSSSMYVCVYSRGKEIFY